MMSAEELHDEMQRQRKARRALAAAADKLRKGAVQAEFHGNLRGMMAVYQSEAAIPFIAEKLGMPVDEVVARFNAAPGSCAAHPMRDGYVGSVVTSYGDNHLVTVRYALRAQADAAQAWLAADKEESNGARNAGPADTGPSALQGGADRDHRREIIWSHGGSGLRRLPGSAGEERGTEGDARGGVQRGAVAGGNSRGKAGTTADLSPLRPRGVHELADVVLSLLKTGRYVDEEGEATTALLDLLRALIAGTKEDPLGS